MVVFAAEAIFLGGVWRLFGEWKGGKQGKWASGLAVDLSSCASACLSACLRWSWLVAWKSNKKPNRRRTKDDGLSLGRPERGDLRGNKQVSKNTRGRTSCCYFVRTLPLPVLCGRRACVGLFPWFCERKSAEHTASNTRRTMMTPLAPNYVYGNNRCILHNRVPASMYPVQALKALYVSLSHSSPFSPPPSASPTTGSVASSVVDLPLHTLSS